MKVTLKAHPAGAALLAAALLWLESGKVLAALLALMLHEGGHVLAMRLCGVKRCCLELTPFGGVADVPGFHRLPCLKQGVIALAGVAVSALGALCWAWRPPSSAFWLYFRNACLSLALMNCLPLWPLDGARLCLSVAGVLGWERAAARAMLLLSYLAAFALLALGVYGAWRGAVNLSLFLLPPYLCYAAYESAVCCRIRGFEQAVSRPMRFEINELKAVKPFACRDKPTAVQLARLAGRATNRLLPMLYQLDPDTGEVEKTFSYPEMAEILSRDSL